MKKRDKVLNTIATIIAVCLALGMLILAIGFVAFSIWFVGEGAREIKQIIIAKAMELAGGMI